MPDATHKLVDPTEDLLRQVPTVLVQEDGTVMSTAFCPSRLDDGGLSTLRGYVGPEEAYLRWAAGPSAESRGTWSINVGFAAAQDLPAYDDSGHPEMPEDHATVDFTAHSKGQRTRLARILRDKSVALFVAE